MPVSFRDWYFLFRYLLSSVKINFLNFSRMKRILSFFIFFFVGTALVFSQQTNAEKELLKRVTENYKQLSKDPEKSFSEAQKLEKEAQGIDAKEAELISIETQCSYYSRKNDFKNTIIIAKRLFERAKLYKNYVYQLNAKYYSAQAFLYSELPNESFSELEDGKKIINKVNSNDSLSITSVADLFIAYSNYYSWKEDHRKELKYVKLAGKEYEKLKNTNLKNRLFYINYSNLGDIYNKLNLLDSAKYYADFSQSYGKNYSRTDVDTRNFIVLGQVALKKDKNYRLAISYFKSAEKLKGNKQYLNVEDLYDNFVTSYEHLSLPDSAKLYRMKIDSLKLQISENQKRSLHTLLNEEKEKKLGWYVYVLLVVLVGMLVFTFVVIRKNKILSRQEKISQEYLEKVSENPKSEDYSRLLEMLKKNDPLFMVYFNEAFPEFSSKLEKINPKITPAETEFCALLKLKIPTKDISKYKYIELQTVRNKKYLIRKKFHIPQNVDIYKWFDDF